MTEQKDIVVSFKLDRDLASTLKKLCQKKGISPNAFLGSLLTRILQDKKIDIAEGKKMVEVLPKKTQEVVDRIIALKGEIKKLEAVKEERGYFDSLFDSESEEELAIKRCRQELEKLRVRLRIEVAEEEPEK